MKKSADISKYDIHWQVFRVGLKKLSTMEDKVEAAASYLEDHPNRADKERVLNYLEGLSMAYTGDDRKFVIDTKVSLSAMEVSGANETSTDFSEYDDAELLAVAKDLTTRSKKWLKKGYVHKEQMDFVLRLWDYLGHQDKVAQLEADIRKAEQMPNTHSFFF